MQTITNVGGHLREGAVRWALLALAIALSVTVEGLVSLYHVTAAAQEPPQIPPVFRTGIDVVRLDVTVLDSDRHPVRGLKATDFRILENGQLQPVVAFVERNVAESWGPSGVWMREVASDVHTNVLPDGRLVVLVLDDATIPFDPLTIKNAREIAREVVKRLGPSDLAAIIFTRDNRHAQNFTADRERLFTAIERLTPGFVLPGRAWQPVPSEWALYYEASIRTLRKASEYLSSVPERRKALVYVSTGVPLNLFADRPLGAGNGIAEREALQTVVDQTNSIFLQAHRANVNIYAVDPAGLSGMEFYLLRKAQAGAGSYLGEQIRQESSRYLDFLQTLANNSGGRAVINTNDFIGGITQIFRETAAYYLLGYQPTRSPDAKFRRLEVLVNRPDLTVLSRKGYYAPRPNDEMVNTKRAAAAPLETAMAGLLPTSDLPMNASVAAFALPGNARAAVLAVALGVQKPASPSLNLTVPRKLDFQMSVFTPEGKLLGSERQTAVATTSSGRVGYPDFLEVLWRCDLKPGRYELRFAAHSSALEKSGSVYAYASIPDFAGAPLSLSGAVLSAAAAEPPEPNIALAAVIPVVPTSQREFATEDKVTLFVRVYQGGRKPVAPVVLNTRILDSDDRPAFEQQETVSADRFGPSRAMDYLFDLPLARLTRGSYLFTFEAGTSGKTTTRRDVRFSVR